MVGSSKKGGQHIAKSMVRIKRSHGYFIDNIMKWMMIWGVGGKASFSIAIKVYQFFREWIVPKDRVPLKETLGSLCYR